MDMRYANHSPRWGRSENRGGDIVRAGSIVIRAWSASFGKCNGDQGHGRFGESLSVYEPSARALPATEAGKAKPDAQVQSALRAIADIPWFVGLLKKIVRNSQ